jgi:hypothetical protein
MRSGWSHAQISMVYWAAMAACGVIGFYLARTPNSAWPWIVLVILAGLWTFISLFARSYASAKGFDQ